MSKNEFLLPKELGWECNDELSKLIVTRLFKIAELGEKSDNENSKRMLLKVGIAEIIDDMYAVIKKYQAKQ